MTSLHPGAQLDHYRLENLVARSGMASIYRGTDLQSGRPVAIKIPHPEVEADPLFYDHFKRDEEIGKKPDHLGVMLYEMLTGEVPFHGPNAFAIMNDRLLNNPVPPRELNPEISPQLQEIIYRAIERKPENRYASAREFARDLLNPSEVGVAERPELRDWRTRRSPWARRILLYVILALIPVVIFGLLLLVAMQHK